MTTEVSLISQEYPVSDNWIAPSKTTTENKTTRIWLGFAAAICLVSTAISLALTFTVSPVFLAAAIPFAVGFGAIVWYNHVWVDFNNPQELAAVRLKARSMSLSQIAKKYGWDKVFQYSILSPTQFQEAYKTEVSSKPLAKLVDFYETASHAGGAITVRL